MPPTQQTVPRILARLARHGLLGGALASGLWFCMGFDDAWLLVALGFVVMPVWLAWTASRLAPVTRWQRAKGCDDQVLIAAKQALDQLEHQSAVVFVACWVAAYGVMLARVGLGLFGADPLFGAERALAVLLCMGMAGGMFVATRPVIEGLLLPLQTALASELGRRRVRIDWAPGRVATHFYRSVVGLMLGISLILAVQGAGLWTRSVRARAVAQQRHLAELAAVRVRHGETDAIDGDRVRLVSAEALPERLAEEVSWAESGVVEALDPRGLALAAAPVVDGQWVLAEAPIEEPSGWIFLVVLLIGVASATRGVAAVRRLAEAQTQPMDDMGATMHEILSEGRMLDGGRVPVLRNDETGRLSTSFNDVLDTLAELASAASAVASGDLRVELERPGDLYDAFRGMLHHLREVVGQIREVAVELSSTAAELHAGTLEQQRTAELQSESIVAVSGTVGALSSGAEGLNQAAVAVLDNAERASHKTEEMAAKIVELGGQAGGIGELLELIREVADRSDLLALNGSLEATRAGEAGRGFALVASEMRRLAERVSAAVADVRARLRDIERSTASAMTVTDASRQLVRQTAEAARTISTITFSQSEDTKQASEAIRVTADGVTATAVNLSQTREVAEDLRQIAARLEQLTQQFSL